MTKQEIINQCQFNIKTINSPCVECNEKAKEFYLSIINYLSLYDCLSIEVNKLIKKCKERIKYFNQFIDDFKDTDEKKSFKLRVNDLNCILSILKGMKEYVKK